MKSAGSLAASFFFLFFLKCMTCRLFPECFFELAEISCEPHVDFTDAPPCERRIALTALKQRWSMVLIKKIRKSKSDLFYRGGWVMKGNT